MEENFASPQPATYVVVFGDLDQVLDGGLQLAAGHGRDHHGVELGRMLPHVLLVGVHQTLQHITQRERNVSDVHIEISLSIEELQGQKSGKSLVKD